jgi:hypothetical protein
MWFALVVALIFGSGGPMASLAIPEGQLAFETFCLPSLFPDPTLIERHCYVGMLQAAETHEHVYDSLPSPGSVCNGARARYDIELRYVPPTDALTLTAGGVEVEGSNGHASISFVDNECTRFSVVVIGNRVTVASVYSLELRRYMH